MILKFLGFSPQKTVRDIYLIDDRSSVLRSMDSIVSTLKGGIITGAFKPIHVPLSFGTDQ